MRLTQPCLVILDADGTRQRDRGQPSNILRIQRAVTVTDAQRAPPSPPSIHSTPTRSRGEQKNMKAPSELSTRPQKIDCPNRHAHLGQHTPGGLHGWRHAPLRSFPQAGRPRKRVLNSSSQAQAHNTAGTSEFQLFTLSQQTKRCQVATQSL